MQHIHPHHFWGHFPKKANFPNLVAGYNYSDVLRGFKLQSPELHQPNIAMMMGGAPCRLSLSYQADGRKFAFPDASTYLSHIGRHYIALESGANIYSAGTCMINHLTELHLVVQGRRAAYYNF